LASFQIPYFPDNLSLFHITICSSIFLWYSCWRCGTSYPVRCDFI